MAVAEQRGNSTLIDAKWTKARQLISAGSFREAESLLTEVVAAQPHFGRAWQELGSALHRRKAYPEALEAFQKRINLEPNDAIANYSLAVALMSVGRNDEARLYLDRAISIKPDFREAQARRRQMTPPPSSLSLNQTGANSSKPQDSGGIEMLSKELQQGKVESGRLIFEGRPMLRSALVPSLLVGMALSAFYFVLMLTTGAFR